RSDTGCFLLAECFGSRNVTLVKDVDGLYDRDPKTDSGANFIDEISTTDLRKLNLDSLPFEGILVDLLDRARLMDRFQIINGRKPELIEAALKGEHVGTIIHR
ncbi:MAG: uridylate kinase, partial [Merismopedia sp. SIO2A8]|nr:uridylate kinase [Merismopedia sp. SIO2A8]